MKFQPLTLMCIAKIQHLELRETKLYVVCGVGFRLATAVTLVDA